MKGITRRIDVRGIGMTRAKFNIDLANLVYNMFRYSLLLPAA